MMNSSRDFSEISLDSAGPDANGGEATAGDAVRELRASAGKARPRDSDFAEALNEDLDDDVDFETFSIEPGPSHGGGGPRGSFKNNAAMATMMKYPTKSMIGKLKRVFFSSGGGGSGGGSGDGVSRSSTMSGDPAVAVHRGFLARQAYAARVLLMGSRMNVLLAFFPLAIMANPWALHWGETVVFAFSLLALCPLAERLGFITEQIAMHTNDNIGGLLNATFGNATELIISIFALKEGLLRVVQLSLLGSIISNMLLVLGSGLIAGGCKRSTQYFNRHAVMTSTGLLLMALTSLILPSVLNESEGMRNGERSELWLSRFTSFAMLIAYGLYLFFTLKTHKELMEEKGVPEEVKLKRTITDLSRQGSMEISKGLADLSRRKKADAEEPASPHGADGEDGSVDSDRAAALAGAVDEEDEEEEEDEEMVLGITDGIIWLSIVTLIISLLSEWLVDTIETSSEKWGVSMSFLSTIVLPIVGNAAEHASAIIFAYRNKLDLALGVAIGSSTQIAMFVIPACVLLGWAMGKDLSLDFSIFETTTLFATVLVVTFYMIDGQSNWLKGVVLLLCYIIISASFYVHTDPSLVHAVEGGGD